MSIAYTIKKGMPYPMGVTSDGQVMNIAVEFPHSPKEGCGIILYTTGHGTMRIPFSEECRTGLLYCVCIEGIYLKEFSYLFYVDDMCFCDPYARKLRGREKWGSIDPDSREMRGEYKTETEFDWEGDKCLEIPYENSVIYGLHLRGFTRHTSSGVSAKGTFEGLTEKIPYLQEIGITAVACMPIYEFDEILFNPAYTAGSDSQEVEKTKQSDRINQVETAPAMHLAEVLSDTGVWKYRINYWGFGEEGNYYFSPKNSYAASGDAAFSCKQMVKALHRAGIECIMQIYFPTQYAPGFILEVLRFWVMEYHIDGFHLMGRKLPMELLGSDAVLKRTKLYCENPMTDRIYEGASQPPVFRNLACYREDFQTDMRRFLKGDEDMLYRVGEYTRSNSPWEGQINHMADYKGFTLMDMVSYDRKHNEENGEDNRDGSDYNHSWNCGVEGPSRKAAVQKLRLSQRKNALSFLMLSQGTPFIQAGDEFGHSASGNNNAYCHDNKVNWLNWKFDKNGQELLAFTKELITFRKMHSILHSKKQMRLMDYESYGYPDLSYHGEQAWYARFENYNRHLGIMYCGLYEQKPDHTPDDFLYIAYNMHWITHEFALPLLPRDYVWENGFCTGEMIHTDGKPETTIAVPPRSVLVLVGKKQLNNKKSNKNSNQRKKKEE